MCWACWPQAGTLAQTWCALPARRPVHHLFAGLWQHSTPSALNPPSPTHTHTCARAPSAPLQTLCHLAKAASSADAVALLDCTRFHLMTAHELAAAALYLQQNSKWVDKRLSTALAWRLLNARTGADLGAWPAPAGIPGERGGAAGGSGIAAAAAATAAASLKGLGFQDAGGEGGGGSGGGEEHPRPMRQRCLAWGLSTARLAGWGGTTM